MDVALAQRVRTRAGDVCEYCLIPQSLYPAPFQIDHVIARQHTGPTRYTNLALSCLHCNGHKGPNIAGLDSKTGKLTRLFNPRRHRWHRHFRWDGVYLAGRSAVGRATIAVLNMNGEFLVQLRMALAKEGQWPPTP